MSDEIQKTGVFATDEQRAECLRLFRDHRADPVVRVHGQWLPDLSMDALMSTIDAFAITQGLPPAGLTPVGEVDHYGMLGSGEFTRRAPAPLPSEKPTKIESGAAPREEKP